MLIALNPILSLKTSPSSYSCWNVVFFYSPPTQSFSLYQYINKRDCPLLYSHQLVKKADLPTQINGQRENKYICMYVCVYICMYIALHCLTSSCIK